MHIQRPHLLAGAAVLGLACVAWYWLDRAAPPPPAEPAVSAQIQSARVSRQAMPLTLAVAGELAPGTLEALSFAQAGQVLQLTVLPGQLVRRGELLAVLASDPMAVSNHTQAANAQAFAERELARLRQLQSLQLATDSQVDAAQRQLQDAQAALAAQASLGGAQASTRLLAPFDGQVGALPVLRGERVAAGSAIVQLGRLDAPRVQLALEPEQSARVRAGMAVQVDVGGQSLAANISQVQRAVDPKSQMVIATALFAPGQHAPLINGVHVQAKIALGMHQLWALPRQAVLNDDQGAYLYQVRRQHARRVAVRKVLEEGARVGVEGELDPNETVVVLGNYELEDGMAVREAAP